MSKVTVCDEPPVCECCKRAVVQVASYPITGCAEMICFDCFGYWYDPDEAWITNDDIRRGVLKRHGETGGQADLTDARAQRQRYIENWLGTGI